MLVILTRVYGSVSCPSFHHSISLSVHWGFNYRNTEEPHYTQREGTERDRNEGDGGYRQTEGEMGIKRKKSDLFATEILNIIIPDTTRCSRN